MMLFIASLLVLTVQDVPSTLENSETLPLLTHPAWQTRLDAAPPPGFASFLGLNGQVTLNCLVELTGELSDCKVVKAVPARLGFEEATLSQVHTARLIPGTNQNGPTTSRVEFIIRFSGIDEFPGEPWSGPAPNSNQLAAGEQMASFVMAQTGRNPFFREPDLEGVDPAIISKVESVLNHPASQAEFAAHRVEVRAILVQAWAAVLAKNNLQSTPWESSELGDLTKDFFNAYNHLGKKAYELKPNQNALRDRFCAVHDCGPQD